MFVFRFLCLAIGLAALGCGAPVTRYPRPTVPTAAVEHQTLASLLYRYVMPSGGVDYDAWKADRADVEALDGYLGRLAAASPENRPQLFATRASELAYWINLYNAVVLREVLRRWPLESVRDVKPTLTARVIRGKGFFYDLRFEVGGRVLNLLDLENEIIRGRYDDARIHFAINCASGSCPVIQRDSFEPGELDDRLELATVAFVNDRRNVEVDVDGKRIRLSKLFDTFEKDFVAHVRAGRPGSRLGVLDFIAGYARGSLVTELADARRRGFRVAYRTYDWSINSQRRFEPRSASPLVGSRLPDVELATAGGATFRPSQARGRVLVLDFWATYCRPCRDSLPELAELAAEHSADLVAVAVALDEDDRRVDAFLAEIGIAGGSLLIGRDPGQTSMGAPLSVRALPTVVVVDRDGIVRAVVSGAGARERTELEAVIADLVGRSN